MLTVRIVPPPCKQIINLGIIEIYINDTVLIYIII